MKTVSVSLVLILALLFLFFRNAFPSADFNKTYRLVEISSPKSSSKLFIKRVNWGITADHQMIAISNSSEKESIAGSAKDYNYHGLGEFLYKLNDDTLFVIIRNAAVPPTGFKSGFVVVQKELTNPEMLNLLEKESFKAEGFTLFQ